MLCAEEGNITHWQNTCLSCARPRFVPRMEGRREGEEMGARGEREKADRDSSKMEGWWKSKSSFSSVDK